MHLPTARLASSAWRALSAALLLTSPQGAQAEGDAGAACAGSRETCQEEASLLQTLGRHRARGAEGPCDDHTSPCGEGLTCVPTTGRTWAQCVDCRSHEDFQASCVFWGDELLWPAQQACDMECQGRTRSYPTECITAELQPDWPTDQCTQVAEGHFDMSCLPGGKPWSSLCGARLSSLSGHGAQSYSVGILAAPGPGVATTFYLYTQGRENSRERPWIEVDFEILGKQISDGRTRVWTNLFIGTGTNAPKYVELPFDASEGYHDYSLDVGCCTLKYMVDSKLYRTVDLSYFPDVRATVNHSDLDVLLSVWGQNSTDGGWTDMGFLDDNEGSDLVASYKDSNKLFTSQVSCPTRSRGPLAATKKGLDGWETFTTNASKTLHEQAYPTLGPPGTVVAGFRLIGNGACRTAGTPNLGDYDIVRVESPKHCHNECVARSWCVGYEIFDNDFTYCELHREEITHTNGADRQCYARDPGSTPQALPTPPSSQLWGSEGPLTLQTLFGRAVSAGANGDVWVAGGFSDASSDCWSTFRISDAGDDHAAVQTCDGSYLTVNTDGSIVAAPAGGADGGLDKCQRFLVGGPDGSELFKERPGGSFFLKSCLGTYVTEGRQDAC